MRKLILTLLSFGLLIGYGQSPLTQIHELPSSVTVQPSPSIASLGEIVNFPDVSNTGVLPIDIPLGTIQDHDLSISISLFYQQAGIQVGQESSEIGLGWALQGKGSITREVRDIPDDVASRDYEFFDTYGYSRRSWRMGWLHRESGRKIAQVYPNTNTATEYLPYLTFPRLPLMHVPLIIGSCPIVDPNSIAAYLPRIPFIGGGGVQQCLIADPNTVSFTHSHPYSTMLSIISASEITRRGSTDRESIILQNLSPNLGVPLPNQVANDQYPVYTDLWAICCGNDLDSMDTRVSDLDTESDMYFVSAPGLSLKFVLDHDGRPRIFSEQEIEISYSLEDGVLDGSPATLSYDKEDVANEYIPYEEMFSLSFASFTVKTDNGYTYIFDQVETSTTVDTTYIHPSTPLTSPTAGSHYFNTRTQATAWHLSKIISPTGREATYSYIDVSEQFFKRNYWRRGMTDPIFDQAIDRSSSATHHFIDTKSIDKISTPNFEVQFNHADRIDLRGGKRIDEVAFYYKKNLTTPYLLYELDTENAVPEKWMNPSSPGSFWYVPPPAPDPIKMRYLTLKPEGCF